MDFRTDAVAIFTLRRPVTIEYYLDKGEPPKHISFKAIKGVFKDYVADKVYLVKATHGITTDGYTYELGEPKKSLFECRREVKDFGDKTEVKKAQDLFHAPENRDPVKIEVPYGNVDGKAGS